jgi:TMEM175 potassium channel family protein
VEAGRLTYPRESVEFSRVLAFTDAVFPIAMTLLVVGIAVPSISDSDNISDLADALNDLTSNIISFFISFAVIGRYWVAHHQFFALLARIDSGLLGINLTYLAFIAFLPFPTALLGTYFENPLSVSIYALNVALISGMEVVMFRHAYRNRLLTRPLTPEVYRWGVLLSLSPVGFFVVSVPVAFLSTTVAVICWFGVIPFHLIVSPRKPEGADEQLRA